MSKNSAKHIAILRDFERSVIDAMERRWIRAADAIWDECESESRNNLNLRLVSKLDEELFNGVGDNTIPSSIVYWSIR